MTRLLVQTVGPHERLGGVHQRFSEGGSTFGEMALVLLLAALFIAFLLFVYRLQRTLNRKEIDDSGKLFRTLLLDLHVTPQDRSLLMNLARDRGLSEPAVLLLDPGIFRRHVRAWADSLPDRHRPKPESLERLATRLFGANVSEAGSCAPAPAE